MNCSNRELKDWIESRGVQIESVHVHRDSISPAPSAFAYVSLGDDADVSRCLAALDGQRIRSRIVSVYRAVTPKAA
jgi:hypothetical protein